MAFTNTKESGLESLIVKWLVEQNGYEQGTNADYNRDYAIDETRLFRFLQDTQPDALDKLGVFKTDMKKKQFLNRLQGEIAKRGVIDVLRNGVKVYPANLIMFYLTPTENNAKAKEMYEKNIFSVTRQLMYSNDSTRLALDMCVFINGLPVITFELKNQLTKQNVDDAVQQYKDDRDPRELLFQFKRCMVHFAVDDARVKFCTKLDGKNSWFLPFDKGYNDGAGNPPNPDGLMTDYLWKKILTKDKLSRIIENYAQVVVEEDPETKKKSVKQIFPRYHQLDCVEKLLADVKTNGVGKRYLIQHSAGSGKSNSIAWLAHQLIGLEKDGHPMIGSVLVVTDRCILDKQIRDNIKQFMQVANTVAWAEHSGDLRKAIQAGKRIIITTVEKFPYVVPDIGVAHKTNHFAVIIDEAHSGQNGRNSAQMNLALSGLVSEDEMDNEDKINAMMEGRKLLPNASYFAFTATPKNKTLETFGTLVVDENGNPVLNEDGEAQHRPFHSYTMKQAIQEGFILDVLKYYTPISSYYKLMKTVQDDPMFDKKRAQKKLRAFVESDSYTISQKAEMMVEHFHEQIISKGKIGGQARAMVVTSSIEDLFQKGNITIMFCTSTLLEGVNLPADNLFITDNKIFRRKMNPVDFRNLIGRVGRISYNLYGNVFFVSDEKSVSSESYIEMLQEQIPEQELSIESNPQALKRVEKKYIAEILKSGSSEIPKRREDQSEESYVMMRKFGLILLRDIMEERDSLVHREFSDFLTVEDEQQIREKFNSSPTLPDDDINTSVDQTKRLIIAIKNGLEYPSSKNGFKYDDIIDFFNKLSKIFDWPIYEKSTLGNESKRKWYAVILSQWMEGSGLSYIMQRAIDYHKQHPENFWVSAYQPPTIYNDNSKEHRNVVFADTLEAIENIVLFSISNYFLRFSNEYKKIHGVDEFDNNWYEYVEFGTTNPLTILLQRNGFSRESATFIKKHKNEYVVHDGSTDELRLRLSLLNCGNTSVMIEAASIRFNAPKLFLEEDA